MGCWRTLQGLRVRPRRRKGFDLSARQSQRRNLVVWQYFRRRMEALFSVR